MVDKYHPLSSRLFSKRHDDIEKIGMREAQVGLFGRPERVSSYVASFLHLEQEPDLRTLQLIGIRGYLPLTSFALHAYGPRSSNSTET